MRLMQIVGLILFSGPHGFILEKIVGRKPANTLKWGKEEADNIERRIHEECPACRQGVLTWDRSQNDVDVTCSTCGYVLDTDEEKKFLLWEP